MDPYVVLGVARDATQREIRRSFRRLALKHHPDRNPGNPAAEATFKSINAAYQILIDPARRRAFDAAERPDARTTVDDVWRAQRKAHWSGATTGAQTETRQGSGAYPPTPEDIAGLSTPSRFVPWKAMAALFLGLIGYVAIMAALDAASGKAPPKADPKFVEWLRKQANFGQP